ncbi:hypothetical protein CRUP_026726, partial [Coryphaenoides rupestris]
PPVTRPSTLPATTSSCRPGEQQPRYGQSVGRPGRSSSLGGGGHHTTRPAPILANEMEKLQELSQSELEDLLEHPERVESMALESDEIQNIQLEREMALASNRSLAEQNLDVKPRLEEQKSLLVERYAQLEAARDTYRQHCALRDGMAGKVSPEALFSRLQTEGAHTEAELLASDFLEWLRVSGWCFLDVFLFPPPALAHRGTLCGLEIVPGYSIEEQRNPRPPDPAGAMLGPTCGGPGGPPPVAPGQPSTPTPTPRRRPGASPVGWLLLLYDFLYPASPPGPPPRHRPSIAGAPAQFFPPTRPRLPPSTPAPGPPSAPPPPAPTPPSPPSPAPTQAPPSASTPPTHRTPAPPPTPPPAPPPTPPPTPRGLHLPGRAALPGLASHRPHGPYTPPRTCRGPAPHVTGFLARPAVAPPV